MLFRLAHAEPSLFTALVTLGTHRATSRGIPSAYLERCIHDQGVKDIAEILRLHTELVYSEPEMEEPAERTIRSRLSLPRETSLSFFDPDPTKDIMPLLTGIKAPGWSLMGARIASSHLPQPRRSWRIYECAAVTRSSGRVTFRSSRQPPEFCNVVKCFVRQSLEAADFGLEPPRAPKP